MILMSKLIRSFNIANSVAFVIGEAKGKLTSNSLEYIALAQIVWHPLFFFS
jgi:tRNA(Leu) C34 or U34 (ribose-2'-O)-methylase TrmL